jgi:Uma2 family endonuclease
VSAATSPVVTTLEAWAGLDEDDSRELVDGHLEDEEVPSAVHEAIVRWIVVLLDTYFRPRGGLVFGSGIRLAVRPRTGRLPDAVAYGPERRPEPRGAVSVPPDIVVEVVSSSPRDERRDRIEKPDDYAAFGVRYYWIIDPDYRSFEVWELGADGRYARAIARIAGRAVVPGCDGLSVDLDELWAEVDRLEAP